MVDVFLSYKKEDRKHVQRVAASLGTMHNCNPISHLAAVHVSAGGTLSP
jgi:hypothetical protein